MKQRPKLSEYWEGGREHVLFHRAELSSRYEQDILRQLRPIIGVNNLEIGTGFGRWVTQYNGNYLGIEIDKRAATHSHKLFGCEIIVADTRYLPLRDGIFDSVLSVGVVEHFPETQLALHEHLRVCKPSGKALVLIPSLYSPFIALPMLRSIHRLYGGADYQTHFGSRYSGHKLREMLAKLDIIAVYWSYIGISLPGRFERYFYKLSPYIGNSHIIVIQRRN